MKKILAIGLSLFLAVAARATVALDSSSTVNDNVLSQTLTFPHTCSGSATVLFVKVAIISTGAASISGATYNGQAMTLIGSKDGSASVSLKGYMFYLNSPASGTHNVVVTASSAGQDFMASSESWTGTDTSFVWNASFQAICGTPSGGATNCSAANGSTQLPMTTLAAANTFFIGCPGTMSAESGYGFATDLDQACNTNETMALYSSYKATVETLPLVRIDYQDAGLLMSVSVKAGAAATPATTPFMRGITARGIRVS